MSAHMKMQITTASNKTVSFSIPENVASQVYDAITSILKLVDVLPSDNNEKRMLSMKEIFPDGSPAMALRGLRTKEGITQKELAEKLGITQTRVSEMETGKLPISKAMAHRIEDAFGMPYKLFL